jgi:hypothetical protein
MKINKDLYVVGWTSQSYEWYGDDDPLSNQGRYKPKGDGGEIVAVNLPTLEKAHEIARELDAAYEEGRFYDLSVYATPGRDWYVNKYHGAFVMRASELYDYELEDASYNPRVKNFAVDNIDQVD